LLHLNHDVIEDTIFGIFFLKYILSKKIIFKIYYYLDRKKASSIYSRAYLFEVTHCLHSLADNSEFERVYWKRQ